MTGEGEGGGGGGGSDTDSFACRKMFKEFLSSIVNCVLHPVLYKMN